MGDICGAPFPFEVVLSDIDGTLLDASRSVSEGTVAAVRRLHAAGVPFALVTGRMPSGVAGVRAALAVPVPAVCYSGALVLDADGRVLSSATLCPGDARGVLDLVARDFPQLEPCYFAGLGWYVANPENPAVRREAAIVGACPQQADPDSLLDAGVLPNKLFCGCAHNPAAGRDLAEAVRRRFPKLTVICSAGGTMVEVVPPGVDKAFGARALLHALGVDPRAALAFGDDANDVPLLRMAGCGVAVGNAAPCALEAADDTAPAATDDGVARYLETLWRGAFFAVSGDWV